MAEREISGRVDLVQLGHRAVDEELPLMLPVSIPAKSIGVSKGSTTVVCPVADTWLLWLEAALPLSWPISTLFWQAVIPPNDTMVLSPLAKAAAISAFDRDASGRAEGVS